MTRTRIGFIGAGGIAHRHFGVLEQFEDVEIVAVADVDHGARDRGAPRASARAPSTMPRAMLDAVELDALYICVPPFAHGAPERAAIAARAALLRREAGRRSTSAPPRTIAAAVDAARAGHRGRLSLALSRHGGRGARRCSRDNPAQLLSGYWLDSTPPPQWWWHEDQSGGQMVEQTTHLIDLARYLVGEVTRGLRPGRAMSTAPTFPASTCRPSSTASLHVRQPARSPTSPRPACSAGATASACTSSATGWRSS